MVEETCTICLNDFDDDEQCHTLDECNHKFHTKCIINWFRTASTCPNCRDNTKDMVNQIPAFILQERGKELRKISRKKDAPEALKKLVERLKKIEIESKETIKSHQEHRKENKEILNTHNKLRQKTWDLRRKKTKMERLIGIFQAPNYPLPALIIQPLPEIYY